VLFRSFLKLPGEHNIPIQAIGLSLYESLGKDDPEEKPGTKVTRTQWLDLSSLEMASLIGKNILIVDEVDDTRTTLEYAVRELQKDVEIAQKHLGREAEKTTFSIFVLHVSRCATSAYGDFQDRRIGANCCLNRTRRKRRRASCLMI
jgi:hypoxanthine phosphoribosyltransferase